MHRKIKSGGRVRHVTAACSGGHVHVATAVVSVGEEAFLLAARGDATLDDGLAARYNSNVVVCRAVRPEPAPVGQGVVTVEVHGLAASAAKRTTAITRPVLYSGPNPDLQPQAPAG